MVGFCFDFGNAVGNFAMWVNDVGDAVDAVIFTSHKLFKAPSMVGF